MAGFSCGFPCGGSWLPGRLSRGSYAAQMADQRVGLTVPLKAVRWAGRVRLLDARRPFLDARCFLVCFRLPPIFPVNALTFCTPVFLMSSKYWLAASAELARSRLAFSDHSDTSAITPPPLLDVEVVLLRRLLRVLSAMLLQCTQ
jgi:hypothetical protein